ncbi:dienelactone hydrolase family protein [Methanolobus chelungpuianus]|uniref:DeoR family transcriptional regulator n=1 Tax=Methanolobus chelungpuianus TaxID=502115 RepID=A0AAE3HAB0_9EURY|nr:dienelactone hydrolase family protein [Methanolobus chelungpuianus]MCQ6962641.1 DeoR family transcriptional regulator [Methanolobus chelungpuianus]
MSVVDEPVSIPLDSIRMEGNLSIPDNATGIVVFAHGSGSSRLSPRNRFVAQQLQGEGLATLLFDLLTPEEERIDAITAQLRFDIELLAIRLVAATDWLLQRPDTNHLDIGYFGASTGAAAALTAAALRPDNIKAVVSRGGRPDLTKEPLENVKSPTLLIVGGRDTPVIGMNEWALDRLRAEKELRIVPGATHLFEEPGKLEEVAALAGEWFTAHLGSQQ